MDTTTMNETQLQHAQKPTKQATNSSIDRRFLSIGEGMILLGLGLVALIPRIILATQLDMVTDEGTYIIGGKVYLPLVLHFRLTSQRWGFNYEHPPLVKLLIGVVIYLNGHLGHLFGELLAARMPSILSGTLLVLAVYWLGRAPFGRAVALLFALRPKLPKEQRPPIPWRWWLGAILLSPVIFFIADPAIWSDPLNLLLRSFSFELNHSINGHLTFIAGQNYLHVPQWAILYIIFTKMSLFVTVPAACFVVFALVQLVRSHLPRTTLQVTEISSIAFLFTWLCTLVGMFSLLNIVVGTHYHIPIAVPVALAGAFAWATLFRYRRGALLRPTTAYLPSTSTAATQPASPGRPHINLNLRAVTVLTLLTVFLVGPHLVGLTTVYAAEGYTSEAFHGENDALQVAYPAYREASFWLMAHTHRTGRVGLVAISGTLNPGYFGVSWYTYNPQFTKLNFIEAHPDAASFPYDYLVWPMHLIQRGYAIPAPWRSHIVHVISGGATTYCFIMARDPATIS